MKKMLLALALLTSIGHIHTIAQPRGVSRSLGITAAGLVGWMSYNTLQYYQASGRGEWNHFRAYVGGVALGVAPLSGDLHAMNKLCNWMDDKDYPKNKKKDAEQRGMTHGWTLRTLVLTALIAQVAGI